MEYRRSNQARIEETEVNHQDIYTVNNPVNNLIHILDAKFFRVALVLTILVLFFYYQF
ncbi:hypothetical protein ACMGE6_02695 [Macrococcus equi]|uniref:hypothetical protein n=1 Tax=Macrococcus equi TaxID=3395462 RepID=UPI0039BEA6BE